MTDDYPSQMTDAERARWWEAQAKRHAAAEEYYRTELAMAHELLGRVTHQLSHRWDSVRLTRYFPTDNLRGKRSIVNPRGRDTS